jgi:hypothetical protein
MRTAKQNPWMSLKSTLRLLSVLVTLVLAQVDIQAQVSNNTNPGTLHSGINDNASDLSSASDESSASAYLEVNTPVVNRILVATAYGISPGSYEASIIASDGTVVRNWTQVLQPGVSFAIDIEKVETGVYVLAIKDARTLTDSFYKN